MDARRLSYLRALDIDVWERKAPPTLVGHALPLSSAAATGAEAGAVADANAPVSNAIPNEWSALETAVSNCTRCALHQTRTQTVFGVGNRQAEWMIIGEAPGADEDAQGEPFVGRAGQLLNSMIKAIGLARSDVYIANILKSRPPNNRDPAPEEVAACMPFLQRQIELVNPKLILCVGRIAAQNLLNTTTPIGKLRGQIHALGTARRPVVVTYHPAYLLRSPGEKRRAWQDLMLAMNTMRTLAGAVR